MGLTSCLTPWIIADGCARQLATVGEGGGGTTKACVRKNRGAGMLLAMPHLEKARLADLVLVQDSSLLVEESGPVFQCNRLPLCNRHGCGGRLGAGPTAVVVTVHLELHQAGQHRVWTG